MNFNFSFQRERPRGRDSHLSQLNLDSTSDRFLLWLCAGVKWRLCGLSCLGMDSSIAGNWQSSFTSNLRLWRRGRNVPTFPLLTKETQNGTIKHPKSGWANLERLKPPKSRHSRQFPSWEV
jgi:hypothetical protein